MMNRRKQFTENGTAAGQDCSIAELRLDMGRLPTPAGIAAIIDWNGM